MVLELDIQAQEPVEAHVCKVVTGMCDARA